MIILAILFLNMTFIYFCSFNYYLYIHKESEAYWQSRIKTIEPFGMNLICEHLELTGEKGLLNNE